MHEEGLAHDVVKGVVEDDSNDEEEKNRERERERERELSVENAEKMMKIRKIILRRVLMRS